MNKVIRGLINICLVIGVLFFPGNANAFALGDDNPVFKPVADEIFGGSGVTWVPKVNYAKLELSVSRPDGSVFQKTFDSGSTPYLDLSDIYGEGVSDGSYTYELRVLSRLEGRIRDENIPQGRKLSGAQAGFSSLTQTGYFLVRGGMIMNSNISEPRNAPNNTQEGLSRTNDYVIVDDLIVESSACIGMDCINGESFGFDTIRLKENNLRIRFWDTSSSAGFPSNDWQITANDSVSGGANKFSIDDIDSGRTPFTIEAATRANALYVDDAGRVGLGTSTPAEDLHIWYGDTPTIRLHQSGGGWTPQTWDICGNEANFFIRDVTYGSLLPFRIKPGAPTNSLFINSTGKVGIGTDSPAANIEVQTTGDHAVIMAERTDGAVAQIAARLDKSMLGSKSNHNLNLCVDNTPKMTIATNGYIGVNTETPSYPIEVATANNARLEVTGNWVNPSSRELKENIENLNADEAFAALEGLNPVKYNFKVDKTEGYVGFIAEDVPDLVATKDKKGMITMDVVAVLTKVVQEQQKSIQEQQKSLQKQNQILLEQQKTISELEEKIAEFEKKLH